MNFSKESIEGPTPAPDGWYQLIFKGFKPTHTKDKSGINLNPVVEIVNHTEHDGKRVFDNGNVSSDFGQSIILALVHATGQQEVPSPNGDGGWSLPGVFDGENEHPNEPEKWNYLGPMTNQVFEAELYVDDYNGRKSNKIAQYKCSIPGCTVPHPTNLRRKNK